MERMRGNCNNYVPKLLKLDKGHEATPAANGEFDRSNAPKGIDNFRQKASFRWP